MLTNWQIFIFPVFVIIFLLTSKRDGEELVYVMIAAFIFDFFSGYRFGFMTFVILVIALAIYLFKTRFNVEPRSFLSLAIYSLIFTLLYFTILSTWSKPSLIIDQFPIITTETLISFFVFNFLFKYVAR